MISSLPIGIFDSGVGGLTVYRALHERLPHERFVYLGDTARVPYGTKSLATVERYAIENARFLATRGIKLLIVACNTASALALPAIQNAIAPVKVIGVIEPGARAAVKATRRRRIGVIATEATINSHAYRRAIEHAARRLLSNHIETENTERDVDSHKVDLPEVDALEVDLPKLDLQIAQQACPLFVPLAEEGETDGDATRLFAARYLNPLREQHIDTLVLGCTHYPILRGVISETIGANVTLIDSGAATAHEVAAYLQNAGLENPTSSFDATSARRLCDDLDHFFVTDAAQRFARVAERFLGAAPTRLEAVEVFGSDALR